MRKIATIAIFASLLAISFSSCRDQKTKEEEIIEDMQDKGADIDVSEDGDKVKMETEDEKVKIKTDDEGNMKIKEKDKE